MRYKKDANGNAILDENGFHIHEIDRDEQKKIFRERLLHYYEKGYECIDANPNYEACMLYRINKTKTGVINNFVLYRMGINVFGEEFISEMYLSNKQTIKQLHQITTKLLEELEDVEHRLR